MPSTSVHFPSSILENLDCLAAESGVSRNRLIVDACRAVLQRRRTWPEGLFDETRLDPGELEDLRAGAEDFENSLLKARRSRHQPSNRVAITSINSWAAMCWVSSAGSR